jgi:D-serine deaminase-like pyridoxal phosphate-dependent protein
MPPFPERLEDLGITRPTLLLDRERVIQNLKRMKRKADSTQYLR